MTRRPRLGAFALSLVLGLALVVGPVTTTAAQAPAAYFITGTGDGHASHVQVFDTSGNATRGFFAFLGPTGARVASGDITGDGQPDVIAATGPGFYGVVRAWSLDEVGTYLGDLFPYGIGGFNGGVNIAAGDVDGDGVDEIITAADAGGGPHVQVWDYAAGVFTLQHDWYAYAPGFRGGVHVAVADVTSTIGDEVVTAPGAGGGPHVRVWDVGRGFALEQVGFMAYAPSFTGGVRVAAGALDGSSTLVTGPGPGGGPHVRVWSPGGQVRREFMAYDPGYAGGVNVVVTAPRGVTPSRIVTAPASWGGPHVRVLTPIGAAVFEFMAYPESPMNGVRLAAAP